MDILKEDLLNSVEGKTISVEMETEYTKSIIVLDYVFIDSDENLCSGNNELHFDWDMADIKKSDDIFIVTYPTVSYIISVGE